VPDRRDVARCVDPQHRLRWQPGRLCTNGHGRQQQHRQPHQPVTDMSKGMVGLSMLVQQTLAEDPFICVGRDYVAAPPGGV